MLYAASLTIAGNKVYLNFNAQADICWKLLMMMIINKNMETWAELAVLHS